MAKLYLSQMKLSQSTFLTHIKNLAYSRFWPGFATGAALVQTRGYVTNRRWLFVCYTDITSLAQEV